MQMLTNNIDTMKAEIAAHIDADQVLQGTYWENGKGCFIGCLTHSNCAEKVTERFGLPEPLVKICERVFEGLSAADSVTFFKDVGEAIGVDGKDLSRVHWAFLRDTLKALPKQNNNIQKAIDPVIDGMELLARGQHWPAAYAAALEARAAYAAAADAADAAVAAEAARAAYAAYAADADAGYAAADAAYAAAYAAADAAADAVAARAAYAAYAADAEAAYAAADAAYAAAADAADAAVAADAAYAAADAAVASADAAADAAYAAAADAADAASYAASYAARADAVDAARADAGYAARAAEIKRQSESILALLAAA